jgi:hypothetical protein
MKMKEFLHDATQPVRTEEPHQEPSGPQRPKEWTDVGVIQLANFFLKCWIANLLVAFVFGVFAFLAWVFFLRELIKPLIP